LAKAWSRHRRPAGGVRGGCLSCRGAREYARPVYAVRAGACFDGERFVAGGATVLVDGGRIVGVEPAGYDLPSDCPVRVYDAATVLPGLIDTHVHLVTDSGPMALDRVAGYTGEEIEAVVTEALRRHLAAGVTTVRDLGDRNFNVVDRRDAQRARDDGLPWIVASGPPVTTLGGTAGTSAGRLPGPSSCTPRSETGSSGASTWSR
jgi:imidazolonepropionase-like amidohydrolase